ncbi:MAG: RadC family protein [Alcanivoracaceae bacterium]
MAIRDWPRDERPREKLIHRGADSLSDAELLAIFLRTGLRGRTAVDLGRDLLGRSGGLRELLDMPLPKLRSQPGLGDARLAQLLGALELGRRYLAAELVREHSLTKPEDAGRFLLATLRRYPHEVFACLFLDNRHRVLAFEELFRGTIDGAAVYPREVVRRALDHNAAALILAHNHPSGVAEPSEADRSITRRLVEALGLVDVRVLDHLVIGDGHWVSLAERGWL